MRYAVLTTKHHDGFALWPTRAAGASRSRDSTYRGDLVREFVDATRAAGLRVGFYFSLSDWHHPDYPPFRDEHRPYRFGRAPRPTPEQWERFLAFQFAQIRELLTQYGVIDVLWFDGGWERSPQEWRAKELAALIRELQPDILLERPPARRGRLRHARAVHPAGPPTRRWETCMTMNESWGYNAARRALQVAARARARALRGREPRREPALERRARWATARCPPSSSSGSTRSPRWMSAHAASIHDTRARPRALAVLRAVARARGDRIYLHLLMRPYDTVTVRGVPIKRVRAVRVLASGRALEYDKRCSVLDQHVQRRPDRRDLDPRAGATRSIRSRRCSSSRSLRPPPSVGATL